MSKCCIFIGNALPMTYKLCKIRCHMKGTHDIVLIKADQLHSLKKNAFCLKTSYFMNK